MKLRLLWLPVAALLGASVYARDVTPGRDPQVRDGELAWFNLRETREQLLRTLGPPAVVSSFGVDLEAWQYRSEADGHDFSHEIVLRKNGAIVSITRTYHPEQAVDMLFPPTAVTVHTIPVPGTTPFPVRVRRLPDNLVLLAMGTSSTGQLTSQIVLIRVEDLRFVYPSLFKALSQ